MNFQGEGCPNGVRGDLCLCSTEASNEKWKRDQQALKDALRHYEPIRIHFYVLAFGVIGVLFWDFLVASQPLRVLPFFVCLMLAFLAKTWREDVRTDEERRHLRKQEFLQLRCAVNYLLTREANTPGDTDAGRPENPSPYAPADNKAVLEQTRVADRTARNREVKRHAKERKAEGMASRQKKQRLCDLSAVVESLEYEQRLRNDVAAAHGWPIHPNDIDWLGETERKAMYQAFGAREPFRQEWQNSEAE
jgi:hypothetical protein